jgi:hypothetical protein
MGFDERGNSIVGVCYCDAVERPEEPIPAEHPEEPIPVEHPEEPISAPEEAISFE